MVKREFTTRENPTEPPKSRSVSLDTKRKRLPKPAETLTVAKIIGRKRKEAKAKVKTEKINEEKVVKKDRIKKLFADKEIEPILNQKTEENGQEISIFGKSEKLFPNAPDMTKDDFLTRSGRYVDYTAADTLPQLINFLREVGEVTNNNEQTIDADTIINLIYEYIYQPKPDWTKITLRHRLRETVYALIEKYKKTPEYLNNLSQVGLFNINNLQDLKAEIIKKSFWTLPNGLTVGNQTIISLIDNGLISDLPGPIRERVIYLNKNSQNTSKTTSKESWGTKIKSWFKKRF